MTTADTPAGAISRLDASLARRGQPVTVRRITAGVPTDIVVTGHVRGYQPQEVVGGIMQGDVKVILSPTGLAALLPLKVGDKLVIGGALKTVVAPAPLAMAGTVVRINVQARG